jgi:hypothetical protein
MLGLMYYHRGDLVRAYTWLLVAKSNANDELMKKINGKINYIEALGSNLIDIDLNKTQQLAQRCLDSNYRDYP